MDAVQEEMKHPKNFVIRQPFFSVKNEPMKKILNQSEGKNSANDS